MDSKFVIAGCAALIFSGTAFAAADSKSMSMSFERCQAVQQSTIAQLGVPASDVISVVNTKALTITRVLTSDGSILISCSAPDQKMVITTSTK
ncbi:hypothetical protein ACF8LF_18420 [Pseudomonas putida]|uniref:hypothetical protein n=1 Tax=Pseudomonas TaxID=286 RepID=UPI001297EC10|nr:hypothetical protein [Pseudomonas helleri]MQU58601.1 hypothetical protein [Pseudomonas helleri]